MWISAYHGRTTKELTSKVRMINEVITGPVHLQNKAKKTEDIEDIKKLRKWLIDVRGVLLAWRDGKPVAFLSTMITENEKKTI